MKKKIFVSIMFLMIALSCFSQKTLCTAKTIDGIEYSIIDVGSSKPDIVMMQTFCELGYDKWNYYVTFKDLDRVSKLFEDALIRSKSNNYNDFDKNIFSFKVTNLDSFIGSNYVEALLLNNGAYISVKFTAYDKYGITFADLHTASFTIEEFEKIIEAIK